MKILVTGGAGYIGSHTCVELLEAGYTPIVIDNLSNSNPESLRRVGEITGKTVEFIEGDVRDEALLDEILAKHEISCAIHFAGLKAVGESVAKPLEYYQNNLDATLTLCKVMAKHNVKRIVNLMNSTIYTVPSCILIILVCAPAAYCLSRFRFFGNQAFQKMILTGLSIPSIMIVMPLCSIISALNMSGSRFTMIFLYTATSVPYTTYFLMTFFKGISNTYAEAATIDGCGQVQCFWRIMFPLAQPAVITVTIFNFITIWNEYFLALVFANKTELRSLGVGLYQIVYSLMNTGDWAGLFAAVVITFIPTVVIYIFLADKIISGVTAGGVKG